MSDWLEGLQAEVDALAERFRQSKIPAEKRIIFESILGVLAEAELLRKESLKTPTRRRQMYSKDVFTDHERAVLADKAVKRLIAETEAKRLPESVLLHGKLDTGTMIDPSSGLSVTRAIENG